MFVVRESDYLYIIFTGIMLAVQQFYRFAFVVVALVAIPTCSWGAWQENVRPKMYVQIGTFILLFTILVSHYV